ncbi:MAG: M16 family metallopeptidase [Planctomycetota bacterium]
MSFERIRDPVVGEDVVRFTTASGLRVRVLPRPALSETAAVITFAYGSTDLRFRRGAEVVETPAGTAHYLEHKLFEDEELAVFQRFGARGARVNAQTGFTRTTYFFQASDRIDENLGDLLRLVGKPHITAENVQKERGIIAQEVRMYEDSPDHCTAFLLLAALYPEHPVRHTVGGTVASIEQITPEVLLQSWAAFYRTGNAALAVAGPVTPEQVQALAEACPLPAGPAPERFTAADFGPAGAPRAERSMSVARSKLLFGLKERREATSWRARAERAAATGVVLDRLFAASSELREAMHRRGEVDDTLGAGYMGERGFGVATVGCDADDPAAAERAVRRALFADVRFDDEQLERLRRRQLGAYVRGCESARALAFGHAHEELEGAPPFEGLQVLEHLQLDDVEARRAELLREENVALAVTRRA